MKHIPNYLPYNEFLGEYISDLWRDLPSGMEMVREEKVNMNSSCELHSHLKKMGYTESCYGLPNKAFTVWSLQGSKVEVIYYHDFVYRWYLLDVNELRNAIAKKYACRSTYTRLDDLIARIQSNAA